MVRRVFYSFHYKRDAWRAAQVRNIGVVEGNQPASDNDWEQVKKDGDNAIKSWIDENMEYRTCTIVLVGAETAGRKWIEYEIKRAWNDENMGLVGIRIHGLKNSDGEEDSAEGNPFADFTLTDNKKLSEIVKCHNPPGQDSKERYNWIENHLKSIVEEAITIRKQHDTTISSLMS